MNICTKRGDKESWHIYMDAEVVEVEDVVEVEVCIREMAHLLTYPHGSDRDGFTAQVPAGHLATETFQRLQ